MERCLVEMHGNTNMKEKARDLYWALPSYPHLWKEKHEEHVLKLFPEQASCIIP